MLSLNNVYINVKMKLKNSSPLSSITPPLSNARCSAGRAAVTSPGEQLAVTFSGTSVSLMGAEEGDLITQCTLRYTLEFYLINIKYLAVPIFKVIIKIIVFHYNDA